MPFPNYTLADITAGALNPGELDATLRAETWTPAFLGIRRTGPTTFTVRFDATPPAGEITLVDGFVLSHPASARGELRERFMVEPGKKTVNAGWTRMGGVVFRPGRALNTLSRGRLRVAGAHNGNLGIMDIRVQEQNPDGTSAVTVLSDTLADASGTMTAFDVKGNTAPRAGSWEYIVQARLGTATAGELRSVSLILRERLVAV